RYSLLSRLLTATPLTATPRLHDALPICERRGVLPVRLTIPEPATHDSVLDTYAQMLQRHPRTRLVLLTHLSVGVEHAVVRRRFRSEEHTSELQSRVELVCRLLLENNNRT